jgi:hypothetical protein
MKVHGLLPEGMKETDESTVGGRPDACAPGLAETTGKPTLIPAPAWGRGSVGSIIDILIFCPDANRKVWLKWRWASVAGVIEGVGNVGGEVGDIPEVKMIFMKTRYDFTTLYNRGAFE